MVTIYRPLDNSNFWIQELSVWIQKLIEDIRHQFLDPETEEICQFLDAHPDANVTDQFLD